MKPIKPRDARLVSDGILLTEDHATMLRWFRVICKVYDTCFEWNWM